MNSGQSAREAIDRLFERYGDEVYQFARFSLADLAEAEDVVQDVFLQALRSWQDFRGDSSERTWLWSIARHRLQDQIRRQGRRGGHEESGVDMDSLAGAAPSDPDAIVDLERSLQHLSIEQRQVFTLRMIQDKSTAETARVLGWSDIRVRVTLHRALKALGRLLVSVEPLPEGEGSYHGR